MKNYVCKFNMVKKLKKWELLEEEDISPSPWFPLFKHKLKLPNGRIVDDYYLSKMGDVVMILPITVNREIVFVWQYKHGAGEVILELPAGRIKSGYGIEQNAIMELEEETGYRTTKIKPLGKLFGEPSKDTYKVFGFLVTGLDNRFSQKFDENEEIEVLHVPSDKVDGLIKRGKICAPDTVAFIKLAQLKHPHLFIPPKVRV